MVKCIDLLADAKTTNLCNFTKMDLITILQFYWIIEFFPFEILWIFAFLCLFLDHIKYLRSKYDFIRLAFSNLKCLSSNKYSLRGAPQVSQWFLKVGVVFKWVKPRLQIFLFFLSMLIAKLFENLVAIASTVFVHGLSLPHDQWY